MVPAVRGCRCPLSTATDSLVSRSQVRPSQSNPPLSRVFSWQDRLFTPRLWPTSTPREQVWGVGVYGCYCSCSVVK